MLMALGELAAGVAHHIRTPLTSISGYLQLMLSRLEDDKCSVSRGTVETLLTEVSSINNVVKELVLLAKPPINKEASVSINRVLEESLRLIFRQMNGEKIEIDQKLSKTLPDITADSHLLQQAIVNIMQNAIEAMLEGGTLSVRSWFNYEANMIVISISDTGSGVPKDILSRIFEPFYTTKLEHMGLGLPVSHSIVSEHGGFININTSQHERQGADIHIYLPIIDDGRRRLHVVQQQVLNLQ
jgi:two-component system sensor histidine kinase AtoS